MKFLILAENSNGTWPYLHFRSMGAFEIHKRLSARNIKSSVIEWFTHWTDQQLQECTTKWFAGEADPVIAVSTPFYPTDVHRIKTFLHWCRQQYPNIKIIHGGSRTYDSSLSDSIDVFFLGRSMQMFEHWLDGKDLTAFTRNNIPLVLVNDAVQYSVDLPVLPVICQDDFLVTRDILGFEVGVGCKFNCTFCNYELRNAGKTTLLASQDLHNYFEQAHGEYGITNFFAADDTINESDEKLQVIADAIQGLSFKPSISCYARLDLITARSKQMDLFEKIGFRSLFFGIESFNPTASKLVRKKNGLSDVYETLRTIKERCPDTFTVGGIIVGLNGDSEYSIRESLDAVVKEKLLDSIQLYPLSITKALTASDTGFHSDLDNNPEKFGYTTKNVVYFHRENKTVESLDWTSDWTTQESATKLADDLIKYYTGKIHLINHMEYAGVSSLQLTKNKNLSTKWQNQAYAQSSSLKEQYINSKYQWFQNT